MRTIDIHEATANLFNLIEQAARGQSFLISVSGAPRVMVIPVESSGAGHARRHSKMAGVSQASVRFEVTRCRGRPR